MEYQIYKGDGTVDPKVESPHYCSPRIRWPDSFAACGRARDLLLKVGKRIERAESKLSDHPVDIVTDRTFNGDERPRAICAILDRMGAVRVEKWTLPGEYIPWSYWVPARGPISNPICLAA